MGLGIAVRLARMFSHSSGNLVGAAVDHFVGYGDVRSGGLANLPAAIASIMDASPDSMTMQAGTARNIWPAYAGRASLIVQAGCWVVDDRISQIIASPETAVRHGADALAVAIPSRYVAFQMAEVAIPRQLFADILRLIAELRPPPDPSPA